MLLPLQETTDHTIIVDVVMVESEYVVIAVVCAE